MRVEIGIDMSLRIDDDATKQSHSRYFPNLNPHWIAFSIPKVVISNADFIDDSGFWYSLRLGIDPSSSYLPTRR